MYFLLPFEKIHQYEITSSHWDKRHIQINRLFYYTNNSLSGWWQQRQPFWYPNGQLEVLKKTIIVKYVHPSWTVWRHKRRPKHLQKSSHCMHCYNIVSKITIRTHFSWPKPPPGKTVFNIDSWILAKETRFFFLL